MRKRIVGLCLGTLVAALGGYELLRRQRAPSALEVQPDRVQAPRKVDHPPTSSEAPTAPPEPQRPSGPDLVAGAPTPNSEKFWPEVEERGKKNFEETLFWARGIQSSDVRDRALRILCQCLLGFIPDNIDIPRAIVLASEIRDPAIRLNAQGQIAVYWAGWKPEQAMAWAQFLPENESPQTPPADERERISWYEYDSREKILQSCIQRWTAWEYGSGGERRYPETNVASARGWISGASLTDATKQKLLLMLPKKP